MKLIQTTKLVTTNLSNLSLALIFLITLILTNLISTLPYIPKANANGDESTIKTAEVPLVMATDDPLISNGVNMSVLNVDLTSPLSNSQTRLDSYHGNGNGPWGYTWRLNLSGICTGAVFQSLRVVTDTVTTNEGSTSGLFLGVYEVTEDESVLLDNYDIAEGADLNAWGPAIWEMDTTPVVERGIGNPPLFPSALGMAGGLDATWSLDDYILGNDIGIYAQHWIDHSDMTAQTTVQLVELTYDDANCEDNPSSNANSNTANLTNPITNKGVALATPTGTSITCSSTLTESGTATQDNDYVYPIGLVEFCFDTGSTDNTVSLTFVTDLEPSQVKARKYNSTNNTYFDIQDATITKTTHQGQPALVLSYTITDNGILDLDPTTGSIKDPVGLAITNDLASQLANTGTDSMLYIAIGSILTIALGGVVWLRYCVSGKYSV